jgi:uncharacterized membrane protein YeiH
MVVPSVARSPVAVLEAIGTMGFAVSGAMAATRQRMDVFGVAVLGVSAATSGATLRDLLLSQPVSWLRHWWSIALAGTALCALLIRTSVETSPACWISVTGVFTLRAYPFHRDWTIATIAPTKTILKQTTPATPHSNFQLPRSGDCVRNDR